MSKQLENARNLYLRGIRDGQIKEVYENFNIIIKMEEKCH